MASLRITRKNFHDALRQLSAAGRDDKASKLKLADEFFKADIGYRVLYRTFLEHEVALADQPPAAAPTL